MKVLIISTSVFPLPPVGYSGTEYLAYHLSVGLAAKGWQVSLVCPEGSRLPEGIEHISCPIGEEEEKTWTRYRGRLERNEWPVVLDATFQKWSYMSSAGRDPALAIVGWHHTSPVIYQSMPPVQYPLMVGVSQAHAEECSRQWGVACRFVYNGVDMEFYKPNGMPRGTRWLALGRYTPEKGFLEMVQLAKRLRIGLDLYGDTTVIASPAYKDAVFREADGYFARANPGVSREATVDLYCKAHGLLHLHRWLEPLGLVVLEAMATGCAPIAMRQGGPGEIIKHGETGFLVDSDDQAAELIRRDAVKEINQETMRQWVEQHFSVEKFVERWEQLLERVIKGERW